MHINLISGYCVFFALQSPPCSCTWKKTSKVWQCVESKWVDLITTLSQIFFVSLSQIFCYLFLSICLSFVSPLFLFKYVIVYPFIVKILKYTILLGTHLYHFFPVSIYSLQCIHCLLQLYNGHKKWKCEHSCWYPPK